MSTYGRATASRFEGQIHGRTQADWMEAFARSDMEWISHARKLHRGPDLQPRKPPVRVIDPAEWCDKDSVRIERMMNASAKLSRG
jgi:hypothetical protein